MTRLAIFACAFAACGDPAATDDDPAPDAPADATPDIAYPLPVPDGFPKPRNPADNPVTAEKAELGRWLFHDKRLSFNETVACGSCHVQARAFTDPDPVSRGALGDPLRRNSMALSNIAYNVSQTWANPVLRALEQQALVPLFGDNPIELGATGHEQEILGRLRADARYTPMFAAAFPGASDPYTIPNVIAAIATFQRTLLSGDSRYDRHRRGDAAALTAEEKRGLGLFNSEALECHHCHGGFNFTLSVDFAGGPPATPSFFNTGLYNVDGAGAYPLRDRGLFEVTVSNSDMGRFKVPSLRNVGVTAPYMHDGSMATLEEVVAFYERGGRLIEQGPDAGDGRASPLKSSFIQGFALTAADRAALLAFLRALTDDAFLTDPRFADPFVALPVATPSNIPPR